MLAHTDKTKLFFRVDGTRGKIRAKSEGLEDRELNWWSLREDARKGLHRDV
jgi:hypothetical protein